MEIYRCSYIWSYDCMVLSRRYIKPAWSRLKISSESTSGANRTIQMLIHEGSCSGLQTLSALGTTTIPIVLKTSKCGLIIQIPYTYTYMYAYVYMYIL